MAAATMAGATRARRRTTTKTIATSVRGLADRGRRLPIKGAGEFTLAMNAACDRKACSLVVQVYVNPIDEAKKTYSLVRHAGVDLEGGLSRSA